MRTVGGVGPGEEETSNVKSFFFRVGLTHPAPTAFSQGDNEWPLLQRERTHVVAADPVISPPLFTLLVESAHFEQAVYGVRGWVGAIKGVTLPPLLLPFLPGKLIRVLTPVSPLINFLILSPLPPFPVSLTPQLSLSLSLPIMAVLTLQICPPCLSPSDVTFACCVLEKKRSR